MEKYGELENIIALCEQARSSLGDQDASSEAISILRKIQNLARDILKHYNKQGQRHRLGRHIINAQEEERKKIARELHDGPAQSIANLLFHLELFEQLRQGNSSEAEGELSRVKELGGESMEMLRHFIREMRPMALDDLGLTPAIKRYVQRFRKDTGISVDLFLQEPLRFSRITEINLFRILQETLHNIKKHSKATKVRIELKRINSVYFFNIKDNGIGFRIEADYADHFGLIGIRERIELMDGHVRINTAPGQGCEVVLSFTES